jgi:DNA helicase-2/ATP-dependent DNA helicase PcrA
MTDKANSADNTADDAVDAEIASFLRLENPVSFFLFAGAGSGKTRSLVMALDALRKSYGKTLLLKGRYIGVITYTNNACDEIKRRLDFDPIIKVSTIHSFVWDLIQGFNSDIRAWLKVVLNDQINELRAEEQKGRAGTKSSIERQRGIEAAQARLDNLSRIKRFIYSPTGDNRSRDSLNHSEVIKIGAAFLANKPVMQKLLITKFPILLIDESQDTSKLLVDAFFTVQANHRGQFGLGLFGDTMQRIYADGKIDLGQNLPADWKTPAKLMNHRCPVRVVKLINKIRSEADGKQQRPRSDAAEGFVRLFLVSSTGTDKEQIEASVRAGMAEVTGDESWKKPVAVTTLILEHHMAAKRLNFIEMFEPLHGIDSFQTGLRDGTLPIVSFFSNIVYPLVLAVGTENKFAATTVVRNNSPLLTKEAFKLSGPDQLKQVRLAKDAVERLSSLFANGKEPSFHDVLNNIAKSNLFEIPESLKPFIDPDDNKGVIADIPSGADERVTKTLEATRHFLNTRFSQIGRYAAYVKGLSSFTTHQGVKGLEFPRVLVVMDDEEAGGFLFSYEKLFGAKEKTATDLRNEREGKETGIDRTRRLFYVTCSRTKQSLAIVAYTNNTAKVREHAIAKEWFEDKEIILIQ